MLLYKFLEPRLSTKFRHRPSQIRTSCSCFRRSTALGRAWDPKVVSGKSLAGSASFPCPLSVEICTIR